MLLMQTLTEHHNACFIIESGVVWIEEGLLQLFQVNVAATIRVHSGKPLVGLRIHTGRNVTCAMKTDYISESDTNVSSTLILR